MINFFYKGALIFGSVLAFLIFTGIIVTFILFPLVVTMYSIYVMYKILKKKFRNHINDDFYYISALYGSILAYGIAVLFLLAIPFINFFVSIIVLLFTLKARDMLKNLS